MRRPPGQRACHSSQPAGATTARAATRTPGMRTPWPPTPAKSSTCSHEEKPMPAYWVARAKVNDPVEYKKYADRVPAILAKYGAKVLTRGGRYQTLEGQEKFNRFVLIELPTFERGVARFNSPQDKEAAAFRRRNNAGENELVMIEAGGGAAEWGAAVETPRLRPHLSGN